MSYASDLGIKVGGKIKVIAPNGGNGQYEDGHVLMLREDDCSKNPIFRNLTTGDDTCCFTITERGNGTAWEHYKKEEKGMAKTPFEQAGYTKETKFKVLEAQYGFRKGEIVTLDWDDRSSCPKFKSEGGHTAFLLFNTTAEHDTDLEVYVEESESTDTTKLKFPCCVATSEIKDEEIFKKILDLFVANGAEREDKFFSYKDNWKWFGVDIADMTTQYYDYSTSYEEVSSSEVTIYTVKELLAMLPEEESSVAQAIHLFPVGTEVKIAQDSEWYKDNDWGNPKDTKGSVIRSRPEDIDDFCCRVEWDDGTTNSYKLNDLVLWEETPSVASQEAITERLEDSPSVGIDSGKEASSSTTEPLYKVGDEVVITDITVFNLDFVKGGDIATVIEILPNGDIWLDCSSWEYKQICSPHRVKPVGEMAAVTDEDTPLPLITIVKNVTYSVGIKGTLFTFTQDELNELVSELQGFEDYE